MSCYLLGVVNQSLRGGSPTQRPIFNRTMQCTQALLEFSMYAQYKSHDDATFELHGRRLASFSQLYRCFVTQMSQQEGESESHCPGNRARV